jgi:hypothetical protein
MEVPLPARKLNMKDTDMMKFYMTIWPTKLQYFLLAVV